MTQLDDEIAVDLAEALDEVGTPLTFVEYLGASVDVDESMVDLGPETLHVVVAAPPSRYERKLVSSNDQILGETWRTVIRTGNGTDAPIDFVPSLTSETNMVMRYAPDPLVPAAIEEFRIVKVDRITSGDLIAAYKVFLQK